MVRLHLVGGFLGSGKTTAIVAAAKRHLARGEQVGVVTNDQGRYLVDTAFVQAARLPAVQVTGGCFCCNYEDLATVLGNLWEQARPDVIYAESVGSCADLVATVVKPLLELQQGDVQPSSLSVFADARLLRRRLLGEPLPFSDDVVYIFDQQLQEAGLLVLNKTDLLDDEQLDETEELLRRHYPNKPFHSQNSLSDESVAEWVDLIEGGSLALPRQSLDIDYARYGAGEASLAWLDLALDVSKAPRGGQQAALLLIEAVISEIRGQGWPIGHLKFSVRAESREAKISFTTLDEPNWQQQVPSLLPDKIEILINARVQAPAQTLEQQVQEVLGRVADAHGLTYRIEASEAFHPGFPMPLHRL